MKKILVASLIMVGWSSLFPILAVREPGLSPREKPPTSSYYLRPSPASLKRVTAEKPADIPKPTLTYLVDNFQDGNLKAWWGFGDLLFDVVENSAGQLDPTVQGRSVRFQGKTSDWVVGGCGRFLGLDSSPFNVMKLMIKGNNQKGTSGRLTVQLFVANDRRWMTRDAEAREYYLKYECQYSHTISINWQGWKVITIPFSNFVPDSPRIKQKFWTAQTNLAQGTLVQLQFVVLASQKKGAVDFQIGSIAFAKDFNPISSYEILDF